MPYESFFYVCPIFVFVDIVATRAMCSTLVMLEAMTDERLTSTCSVIFYFDRSDSRRFVFLPIYPFLSYIYAPFSSLNSFFFNLYFCIFVFLIPPPPPITRHVPVFLICFSFPIQIVHPSQLPSSHIKTVFIRYVYSIMFIFRKCRR